MCHSDDQQRAILKAAHKNQSFKAEVNALDGYPRGHGSFRHLVDIMFSPPEVDEKDEIYHVMILTLQCAYFGPSTNKYLELSDDITMGELDGIEGLVIQSGGRRKYRNTLPTYMSKETVNFLDTFMKLDARDQSSPQELLQDQWLSGVVD